MTPAHLCSSAISACNRLRVLCLLRLRMPLYRRIEENPRILEYDCYGFTDVFRLPS